MYISRWKPDISDDNDLRQDNDGGVMRPLAALAVVVSVTLGAVLAGQLTGSACDAASVISEDRGC